MEPRELIKNRSELVSEMKDEFGYLFCEMCQKSSGVYKFHVHHIMSRGKFPKHPHLHAKQNLIIICNTCHDLCHSKPEVNEKLIKQRNLRELFKK